MTKNLADELKTIGFIGKGYHTARLAWPKLECQFVIGGVIGPGNNKVQFFPTLNRAPEDLLVRNPVDLLVADSVDKQDYLPTYRNKKGASRWYRQVARAVPNKKPKLIVESWTNASLFDEEDGPTSKRHRTLWEELGYGTRVHRWEASKLNSALRQERFLVLRLERQHNRPLIWTQDSSLPSRAMSNILRFQNVPRAAFVVKNKQRSVTISDALTKPLPPRIGDLIRTDKGVRRTLADEYARGAGVPKTWIKDENQVRTDQAHHSTCINIWEAMAETIQRSSSGAVATENAEGICFDHSDTRDKLGQHLLKELNQKRTKEDPSTTPLEPWSWVPPDLREGGGRGIMNGCET